MERKSFADMGCSVAQCLETVGDSWTMLIVRDAFNGVTRFDDFRENLGMPRNTLRDRLARLVDSGVLAKVPYSDHPPRYDYLLTDGPTGLATTAWSAKRIASKAPRSMPAGLSQIT